MADLFEEVEEQLRSDRYQTLARKALPWVLAVLAAALVVALAYWGWDKYRQQTVDKASEQYAAALDAFNKGDAAQARQLWGEVSKASAGGYKSLALMQLGGLELAANKPTEAVALFDKAAKAAPNAVMGDAARLKSAFAILDTAPYKDVETRLTPLMENGHAYRVQAREALAFAKIVAGNTAGARGDFVVISGTLDAPEGARARAKAAIDLIDSGSAKAVAATVRSAATLPPPLIVQPGAAIPGLPAPPQQEAPASQ